MRLDRFCQHGEHFAYKILFTHVPTTESCEESDLVFRFSVELEDTEYNFTDREISDPAFEMFEIHLSKYLNVLFKRKERFEKQNKELEALISKLNISLTKEERRCLATNIDINSANVLDALGVVAD